MTVGPAPDPDVHRMLIEVSCDEPTANAVMRSLSPEAADLKDERSATIVEREDDTIRLVIGADDLVALRAAANTWLGLLGVVEKTLGIAESRV